MTERHEFEDPTQRVANALAWRSPGPHRAGRVVAVAGDPEDSMTFYFGACAGGVWKTTDGGTYWRNVSDGFFNTAAIGALTVSASDPNVIYAGTGETTIRSNVSHGDGVYRSTDAGRTWTHLGLEDTRHIAEIRVHPDDPDIVYVAALGHAWGPNAERGLYRSLDGGKTWDRVLYVSDRAGCIDLSMDPRNPRVLYASFWEAQRTPYSLSSGGPGCKLFRSADCGNTWTDLTERPGLPKGLKGKIGLAVSPAKSGRVWALVEAKDGALFRSDDHGETWQRLSESGDLRRRAWYYMHVFADPQDADTVWVLNLKCLKSVDGGSTFTSVPTPHGDNHDLWIDPRDPRRMIEGNDGGACVSFNGGASWSTIYNQPTAQFYHVVADHSVPYRLYGSQQDNSAISLPSVSQQGAITPLDWFEPGGGESGYIQIRPDNPNIVYAGLIGSGFGNMTRFDRATGQVRNITPWPNLQSMGDGAATLKYRIQWTFPIVLSPHDPNVLYVGANKLLRSRDEGESWEELSPDLTRADPATLGPSGGPISKDNSGAETYGTIFALAESPHEQGVLWAGSDDGLVHLSRDGGNEWAEVTPPALKSPDGEWALISIIELSPHDPGTAYLAATRYKLDDTRPFLFRTDDYGATWTAITAGIPATEFTRVVREDPGRRGLLFAGTETGIYFSLNRGETWSRLSGEFPVVPVYDLIVQDAALVVATHGRSFWTLDDIEPLRQLVDDAAAGTPRLFAPAPYTRYVINRGYGYPPSGGIAYRHADPLVYAYEIRKGEDGTDREFPLDAGENPPDGIVFTYFLPEEPAGVVTLTLLDNAGEEIRTFTSKQPEAPPAEDVGEGVPVVGEGDEGAPETDPDVAASSVLPARPGANRFIWNLRYPDAVKVPGDESMEFLAAGPKAPPGRYTATLTAGDTESTQEFEIRLDPRVADRADQVDQQFRFLLRVRDRLSEVHEAANRIRTMKRQLELWKERLTDRSDDVRALIAPLLRALSAIEQRLILAEPDDPLGDVASLSYKLAGLGFMASAADCRPTRQQEGVFDELSELVAAALADLSELETGRVAAFNARIAERRIPPVGAAAAETA